MSEKKQNSAPVEGKAKRKRGWLRRLWRVVLVLLALVILAVAAAIIWLGPIAERYLESHAVELTGRRITLDNLQVKLFSGRLEADNVVVYEVDGAEEFVRADNLKAAIDLGDIFDKHIHITGVKLLNPRLAIVQNGDLFNFDTLVEYILDEYFDDTEVDTEDDAWRVTIENVEVVKGNLSYYDSEIDQHWVLSALDIHTEEVILGNSYSTFAVQMIINDGATVEGALDFNCDTFDFRFDGAMQGFNLADTYNYWTPYLNIRSVAGIAAADIVAEGNIDNIFAMNIVGDVAADNLAIVGPDGGNLFSATRMDASFAELNIERERYIFDSLTAEGYATEMHFRKDGTTNFDGLFWDDPELSVETTTTEVAQDMYSVEERVTITTTEEVAPLRDMTLRIAKLDLKGGVVDYSDRTMHEDFEYELRNIAIRSENFDLMGQNKLTLRANLPKQGSALFQWEGSLSDFYNQSLLVMLTNVDIKGLSPYVEHFTAFPVTSGNMTFRSQNVVTNGELSGVNQLGTYKFALGKKNRAIDAEYDLPLKLGLFVLTDKDDHIDVDFPITGSIDSPEFSYRKIIMKAIGNLLLKVVAAPFEWMAGDKQDAFRHIDIDLLTPGLDAEHYARIDKMAETLREDGTLKVRLTQRVNYDRAVQRLADLNLKIAFYNATEGDESGYLDMLDFARINEMKLSGREVTTFADSLLLTRGIDPAHMTAHAKAVTLYGDMAAAQLGDLMRHRNRIIGDYIKFQHSDVAEELLTINDVVMEDVKSYRGKDRYTVTLIVDGEEVEIETDDNEPIDEATETTAEEPSGTDFATEDNFGGTAALESGATETATAEDVATETAVTETAATEDVATEE